MTPGRRQARALVSRRGRCRNLIAPALTLAGLVVDVELSPIFGGSVIPGELDCRPLLCGNGKQKTTKQQSS